MYVYDSHYKCNDRAMRMIPIHDTRYLHFQRMRRLNIEIHVVNIMKKF